MMNKYDPSKKTVYVLFGTERDHVLFYDRNAARDGYALPFVYLREAIEAAGYNFKPTADLKALETKSDVAYIISLTKWDGAVFQCIQKHPREKSLLFNLEPYITHGHVYPLLRLIQFFGKIFVIYDDMVDNKQFFKLYHPQHNETVAENVPSFEQKKFAVMVHSNRWVDHFKSEYGERLKTADFFSNKGDFDLYGSNWKAISAWRGPLPTSKKDLIKNYKFCFAYESVKDQYGYISERLFDVMYAKSVPIYLGPLNITNYVPKECFINRADFASHEELYSFMKNMDKTTYESYINAAQAFLKSPQAQVFSPRQLARTVMEHILPA